ETDEVQHADRTSSATAPTFNAKAQRRGGAKNDTRQRIRGRFCRWSPGLACWCNSDLIFSPLCVSASWRLCVNRFEGYLPAAFPSSPALIPPPLFISPLAAARPGDDTHRNPLHVPARAVVTQGMDLRRDAAGRGVT